MIDERTSRLNLALPVNSNTLKDDCERLRETISTLDAKVATVDGNGKIPVEQIPAVAITDTFPVASEAAMLALAAQTGDVAIRSDLSKTFILMAEPASTLANWKEFVNDAMVQLAANDGERFVGVCPDIATLRSIEPKSGGQRITLKEHTAGTGLGGGQFLSKLDGAAYTDNNGTVIKTPGGAVWLRRTKGEVHAVDFGFIIGDQLFADSNTAAILAACAYAFAVGAVVVLPSGTSYVNDNVINQPVTIRGSHPGSGSSLVQRVQTSDLVHIGSGFCFDYPPQIRPNVPSDTAPVVDGIRLIDLNIRGTMAGRGSLRVNTPESIGTVGYERRNTTLMNVTISGYYGGWGFELFNTYTNHLHNVTVWDCAAPYYIRSAHSTDHISCVYENCAWGCVAINTECNNHIGGAIEGIRYMSKMTKPIDYDENGNFPTDTGYSKLYAGIGMRTRGGTTNLIGVYIEANKIDLHLEDSCKITMRDCYINAVSGRTDFTAVGTSGRLVVQNCRFDGTPARERWHNNSTTLLCSHAIITQNHYMGTASRPTSAPNIANVGEFDVYPGTPDTNAVTRIMKQQNNLSVGLSSATLNVDTVVKMPGLTTEVPTTSGQLYVDASGFVKRKQ